MRWNASLLLVSVLSLMGTGCEERRPTSLHDTAAGFKVVFPGEARTNRFTEPTPYGDMEWFSTECTSFGNMVESYFVQVGNLPTGNQGGTTPQEILDTFQRFLTFRLGTLDITSLPSEQGPGFSYQARAASARTGGVVITRRGRIYRAQATSGRDRDWDKGGKAQAFLASFTVD